MVNGIAHIRISQRDSGELRIGPQKLCPRNGGLCERSNADQSVEGIGHLLRESRPEAEILVLKLIDLYRPRETDAVAARIRHVGHKRAADLALYVKVPLLGIARVLAEIVSSDPLSDQRIQPLSVAGRDQALRKRIAEPCERSHSAINRTDESGAEGGRRIIAAAPGNLNPTGQPED